MIRGFLIHHGYYRYDANDCARKTYSNISHQTGKRNITSSFHPPFILSSPALSFFFFFFGCSSWFGQKNQLQEVFDAEDTTDVQMEMPVPSGFLPMGFPELAMQLERKFVTPKMVVVFTRGNPEPPKNAMNLYSFSLDLLLLMFYFLSLDSHH